MAPSKTTSLALWSLALALCAGAAGAQTVDVSVEPGGSGSVPNAGATVGASNAAPAPLTPTPILSGTPGAVNAAPAPVAAVVPGAAAP
ncbi:MAG: hypothetical protein KGM24_01575, partial [Elusimicrobia bacterium]|nr:hypothetical protein [Elusimicrobiota bacterium]